MLKRPLVVTALGILASCGPSQGQTSESAYVLDPPPWLLPGVASQEDPWSDGIVGTGLLLRRLDGVKRVLMIGAHPDDEDTALLTALSRGMGVETAYLSLTRGEGGQNLIGPEMNEGLGLVRTGELLSARALDGGRQYFTRAFDFGYSKTAEETFGFWPREELLRDMVWVVRSFRPQVIVSVFSGTPRDGHGHHQVAGILSQEVFEAAGDSARFPGQLRTGVPAWSPSKLYRLTRRNPQEGTTRVATGDFDPLLGRSHYQVAMESRSQHRSQDMGMPQPLGPRSSTLALMASQVAVAGADQIFTGVDTSLVALARDLPEGLTGDLLPLLSEYRRAIAEAADALELTEPWAAAEPLGRALAVLKESVELVGLAGVGPASGHGVPDLVRSLRERVPLVQEALLRSAGVVLDVRIEDDLLVPGESVDGVVELWNGGPYTVTRAKSGLVIPRGWKASGETGELMDVSPGDAVQWRFRLELPTDAELSVPYFLAEPREGELYRWAPLVSQWGAAANDGVIFGSLELELEGVGEVEAWRPAYYRGVDKAVGEFVEPVHVVPALAVALNPEVMVWPVGSEKARDFEVTVRSQSDQPVAGVVRLHLPSGWEVEPVEADVELSGVGAEASVSFSVTRPLGGFAGSFQVEASARTRDGRSFDQGLSIVDYPHTSRSVLLPPARSQVSVFPVALPEGIRVGYVMGSGDEGPDAIRQMGAEVELLGPEAVRAGDFGSFDVLVLGIRAYETRPDLVASNERVLDFARGGGTLIVQYNKYEYPRGGFAPFPVEMSRPHDRVSDETALVRVLDPSHSVFQRPNDIGPDDFQGWVQERGLYFLSEWGPELTPLLEMADPGEEPKRGSLMVAPLGEGVFVYTGLAFFRQFPEGVPGAYRLFANLLSLGPLELDGVDLQGERGH